MFIVHIALQGCLKAEPVDYGITPDTGGHIKYLLELVHALEAHGGVTRQEIIVRRFDAAALGSEYAQPTSPLSAGTRIVRLSGASGAYVSKENMAGELPALAEGLDSHLRGLGRLPDAIHAHYADAGLLAMRMRESLGIPYFFTAHSLGRSKPDALDDPRLAQRIDIESSAIRGALRVFASSIDEAELQYRAYPDAMPAKIRVNPPGCDLAAFAAAELAPSAACAAIGRGLDAPDKPVILALARPVARKNLGTLVRAYAEHPRLRKLANLVVFAGNRAADDVVDEEARAVLDELEGLIETHALHGHAVLPGRHDTAELPAIYRYAAERRGVFVNCALHEPFGLTLIEAAASGLPVVATRNGGPTDIVGRAGNGLLVDPRSGEAIAGAIERLLEPEAWRAASLRGRAAASRYSWARHARACVADVAALLAPPPAGPRPVWTSLLVCDVDDTLTGCAAGVDKLRDWLKRNPDTCFAVATGRSLHSALDVLDDWNIPEPSVLISSVGSEIHYAVDGSLARATVDADWPAGAARRWPREDILVALGGARWLRAQGPREQRPHKLAYFLDAPERAGEVLAVLARSGLRAEVIASHGRYLDVLPHDVSKGHAIVHVAHRLGIPMANVHGAGNSGNDLHMLNMVGRPIVVGNHSDGLEHRVTHPHAYFAKASFANGVLEGLTSAPSAR